MLEELQKCVALAHILFTHYRAKAEPVGDAGFIINFQGKEFIDLIVPILGHRPSDDCLIAMTESLTTAIGNSRPDEIAPTGCIIFGFAHYLWHDLRNDMALEPRSGTIQNLNTPH